MVWLCIVGLSIVDLRLNWLGLELGEVLASMLDCEVGCPHFNLGCPLLVWLKTVFGIGLVNLASVIMEVEANSI